MQGIIKDTLRNKVWTEKYKAESDKSPGNTFMRVAKAIMGEEYEKVYNEMSSLRFLPGGRILAGAGLKDNLTLANCYVIPLEDDSIAAIFTCAKDMAETYKMGGGVGVDISVLRPRNAKVNNAARISSGSISFMEIFDKVTGVVGGKNRRGALILGEHISHPDIIDFIKIKDDDARNKITNANISVKLTDEFMNAVEEDLEWELWYPDAVDYTPNSFINVPDIASCYNFSTYDYFQVKGTYRKKVVYKIVKAKELWDEIVKRAWSAAEPGLIFWDTMVDDSSTENDNPLSFVNPCAEICLSAYGACCLGSINLARFVVNKYVDPIFDYAAYVQTIKIGVRFLDRVLDKTKHALEKQDIQMQQYRRLGLGFMGVGHCLAYMNLTYDSKSAEEFISNLAAILEAESYKESHKLAKELGAYPAFIPEHISGHLAEVINRDILNYDEVLEHGIRNCALNTCAPSGSISILADCSSGIEPIFELEYKRHSDSLSQAEFTVKDRAWSEYIEVTGNTDKPDFFQTAYEVDPIKKVKLQAGVQKYIDNSISVTTNLRKDATIEDVAEIYRRAWIEGCKGITIYREGSRSAVLGGSSTSLLRDSHDILEGKTIVIPSREGKVYLTLNSHPITDKAVEVFLSNAKSGSDIKAIYEGFARVISLYLQQGGDIADVITTLIDINGKETYFANGWTINSLPDLIAKGLLKMSESISIELPCPECGKSITMTGGCVLCSHCGFSKCG